MRQRSESCFHHQQAFDIVQAGRVLPDHPEFCIKADPGDT